jgi:hypothetical protein
VFAFFRRNPVRARGIALLLLVVGWAVPSIAQHPAEDDRLCLTTGWARDSGDEERFAAAATHQPDHCTICHAARSLRAACAPTGGAAAVLEPEHIAEPPAASSLHAPAYDRLPARAPPAVA